MFFSSKSALLMGLASYRLASALDVPLDACKGLPGIAEFQVMGSDGGNEFCASRVKEGVLIKQIEAWADKDSLRGIKFWYTDDDVTSLGEQWATDDRHGVVSWNPAVDKITKLQTWAGGWNGAMGRIVMELSNGQKMDVGKPTDGAIGTDINLGKSGMLYGAGGRHGGHGGAIDQLTFFFAKEKVKGISMRDMAFDPDITQLNELQTGQNGLDLATLDNIYHVNNREGINSTLTISSKVLKSETESWSKTKSDTWSLGYSIEIEGKIPIIDVGAKETLSFKWDHQESRTDSAEKKTERDLSWSLTNITVMPGKAVHCFAYAVSGKTSADFTATMQIKFDDNTSIDFQTGGHLEKVQWSNSWTVCEDTDVNDALVQIGQGKGREVDEDGKPVNPARGRRFAA